MLSEQLLDLGAECAATGKRLQGLLENRSLWADGIEGCRAALALVTDTGGQLSALLEAALKLEGDVTTLRAECATWAKNHADLAAVERQLLAEATARRAELSSLKVALTTLRKRHADLEASEHEWRTECWQHRAWRAQQESETLALRAALAALQKDYADPAATIRALRAQCEELEAARQRQGEALASARALARHVESFS
jgi:hypothetical protein